MSRSVTSLHLTSSQVLTDLISPELSASWFVAATANKVARIVPLFLAIHKFHLYDKNVSSFLSYRWNLCIARNKGTIRATLFAVAATNHDALSLRSAVLQNKNSYYIRWHLYTNAYSPVMKCMALATLLNMYRASLIEYAPNPIARGVRHIAMTAMAPADRL